jgi:hypothetical protein
VPDYNNAGCSGIARDVYNRAHKKGSAVQRAKTIAVIFALLLAVLQLSSGQQPPQPQIPQPPTQPSPFPQPDNGPGLPPEMQRQMEKRANEQRQADLKRDTDKLLKLSQELKDYVDKSNENVLSLDVIKKADEIEKLAHNVKVKMRGNY